MVGGRPEEEVEGRAEQEEEEVDRALEVEVD